MATPETRGPFSAGARGVLARTFTVTAPADAPLSEPYFLVRPILGELYDWSGVPDRVKGEPFGAPLLFARIGTTIAGVPVTLRREVVWRYDDEVLGEMRRPVFVVPAVGIEISPDQMVWPVQADGARTVTVTLTSGRRGHVEGSVAVELPPGWTATPSQRFGLDGDGAHRSYAFEVRPPRDAQPGRYEVTAVATVGGGGGGGGERFDRATELVDYPHIRPVTYVRDARLQVVMADLALPRVARMGYVRGASDLVPEALQAVGLPVALLTPADLEKGDLSRYDVIVVGSRAYEINPALAESNARLLDYARQGGRLIVQYQEYPYVAGNYAPFPFTIARPHDRVTDETSPVTILDPSGALFRRPNVIGPADWEGWVQERGLYFAHDWDPAYHPMLEMGDAGQPLRGGLLVARVGRGLYVYTGLSFFRELPAGVPGAYRLFANLLALRPDDVR